MSDRVRVEVDAAVRTVTLTRPEKGNAMDAEMLRVLEEAFDPSPGPDATERVAVIRAEGKVFCSGLDLRGSLGKEQDVETLFHRVETWPLPVVAVVQGAAIHRRRHRGAVRLEAHRSDVGAAEASHLLEHLLRPRVELDHARPTRAASGSSTSRTNDATSSSAASRAPASMASIRASRNRFSARWSTMKPWPSS